MGRGIFTERIKNVAILIPLCKLISTRNEAFVFLEVGRGRWHTMVVYFGRLQWVFTLLSHPLAQSGSHLQGDLLRGVHVADGPQPGKGEQDGVGSPIHLPAHWVSILAWLS